MVRSIVAVLLDDLSIPSSMPYHLKPTWQILYHMAKSRIYQNNVYSKFCQMNFRLMEVPRVENNSILEMFCQRWCATKCLISKKSVYFTNGLEQGFVKQQFRGREVKGRAITQNHTNQYFGNYLNFVHSHALYPKTAPIMDMWLRLAKLYSWPAFYYHLQSQFSEESHLN